VTGRQLEKVGGNLLGDDRRLFQKLLVVLAEILRFHYLDIIIIYLLLVNSSTPEEIVSCLTDTWQNVSLNNSPSTGGRGFGEGGWLSQAQQFHPHPSPPSSRGREKKVQLFVR
jgi:hypothetical protein